MVRESDLRNLHRSGSNSNSCTDSDTSTLITQLAEHGLGITEISIFTGAILHGQSYKLSYVLDVSPELTLLPGFEWVLGGNI
jgi:hypothetical protein